MRIVTRPDFDGIVCAVLLSQANNIHTDILWVEPNEIQAGKTQILKGDILANLPYSPHCDLWFDHHISNKPKGNIKGAFDIAPSAAGVVYKYYQEKGLLNNQYDELIVHTDIIDGAFLDQDQVRFPEKYPYILLSMTIKNKNYEDIAYWNHLVELLKQTPIETILEDPQVKIRCQKVIDENATYEKHLSKHTHVTHNISITDFRSLDPVPDGNRFFTYCLFPQSIASVKIRYDSAEQKQVIVSIGRSLFNKQCKVNVGRLLSQFGGGGHAGAGGCSIDAQDADEAIEQILDVMFKNQALPDE